MYEKDQFIILTIILNIHPPLQPMRSQQEKKEVATAGVWSFVERWLVSSWVSQVVTAKLFCVFISKTHEKNGIRPTQATKPAQEMQQSPVFQIMSACNQFSYNAFIT